MNDKALTFAAMLWLGGLVVVARTNWIAKVAAFVGEKTHADAPAASTVQGDLEPGEWARFAAGYVGLWIVLALMLDWEPTRQLAVAFAVTVAGGATMVYGERVLTKSGLALPAKGGGGRRL